MILHILPVNDLEEHQELSTCKCNPQAEFHDGNTIIIHNSFDGREAVEWANEIINNT